VFHPQEQDAGHQMHSFQCFILKNKMQVTKLISVFHPQEQDAGHQTHFSVSSSRTRCRSPNALISVFHFFIYFKNFRSNKLMNIYKSCV
jgi:hypothetical protein